MTPRAFALETSALLNPLSCHAIALTSDAGTPFRVAIGVISDPVTRLGLGVGAASGITRRAGTGAELLTGAPVGSLSSVPTRSGERRLRPFMNAIWPAVTR